MPKFYLNFDVNGATQTITATNKRPLRAGSKNYWYATFNFLDDSFDGLDYLSASFSTKPYSPNRTQAIIVPIVDNMAQIPWEMMSRRRKFYMGIFAGDMLVTNEETLEVTEAPLTGGIYSEPTSTWYDTFIDGLDEKQDKLTVGEHISISEDNEISADLEGAVLYLTQSLTDEQKAQARENIGAGTEEVYIVETSRRGSFSVISPYEDFIEALNLKKTIYCSIYYNSQNYILHNFKKEDEKCKLWEVIPPDGGDNIGCLIVFSFDLNERENTFINISLNSYALGEYAKPVVYDQLQTLTEEERALARKNIGAGTEEIHTIDFNITEEPTSTIIPVAIVDYDEYERAIAVEQTMRARILYNGKIFGYLNQFYNFGGAKGFYDIAPLMTVINNSGATVASIDTTSLRDGSWTGAFVLSGMAESTLAATSTKINKRPATQSLEPFKTYWFYGPNSLSITLRGNYNEDSQEEEEEPIYHFFIVVEDQPVQISLPTNIGYAPGAVEALTQTNTVIEVSISKIPPFKINGITYNYLAYASYMEFNPWD